MDDLPSQIRVKMEAAGLGPAAIRAFLYQYDKLELNEAGLIPESSISPLGPLSSIEDETVSGDTSNAAAQTVVLKLNGGLGTGMGLEKAKSLLKVRDELTFLDIIARQFLHLRSSVAPKLRLLLMNSFSTSYDTAAALSNYPQLGDLKQLELMQNKVPKIDAKSIGGKTANPPGKMGTRKRPGMSEKSIPNLICCLPRVSVTLSTI